MDDKITPSAQDTEATQALSELASIEGLDYINAVARMGDCLSLYHRLLIQWMESEADFKQRTTAALVQHDYESAAIYVHGLKGSSANLGAVTIAEKARELELLIRADPQNERVSVKLDQLASYLAHFFSQVSQIIGEQPVYRSRTDEEAVPNASSLAYQQARVLVELLNNFDTGAIEFVEQHYTIFDEAFGTEDFELCYKRIHDCDFEVALKVLTRLLENEPS